MLNFLNQNSGAFSVVFSGVVAFATVAYVVLTTLLVRETRAVRRAGAEPHVSVYAEPSERTSAFFDLVIANVGSGSAYDLRFSLEEEWTILPNEELSQIGLIKDGIGYLAPGQRFRFIVAHGSGLFKEGVQSWFRLHVGYRDVFGRHRDETFPIDFRPYRGMTSVGEDPEQKLAKAVDEIAKSARSVTSYNKLRVALWTQEDLDRERVEREKRREEMQRGGQAPPPPAKSDDG